LIRSITMQPLGYL